MMKTLLNEIKNDPTKYDLKEVYNILTDDNVQESTRCEFVRTMSCNHNEFHRTSILKQKAKSTNERVANEQKRID